MCSLISFLVYVSILSVAQVI